MNFLALTKAESNAAVQAMNDLGMMHVVHGAPEQPQPIPGRKHDCVQAVLGLSTVNLDSDLRAHTDACNRYISWHPAQPSGISAHKLASAGWIVTSAEAAAALAALDRTTLQIVRTTVSNRYAGCAVDAESWEDWTKMLRGSAESGYPIFIGGPDHKGQWLIAELLLDAAWRTSQRRS
ncbi:hypothetical protein [Streptomyces sp. NPDC015125]|uniref:hypothetical protein n=1 Tax=Streptomyces sp. NPDC015125 TaxID=3364938 RepID=UPI0036FAC04A